MSSAPVFPPAGLDALTRQRRGGSIQPIIWGHDSSRCEYDFRAYYLKTSVGSRPENRAVLSMVLRGSANLG